MKNVKLFDLSFDRAILRFYLMMAVTVLVGLTKIWWLAAVLAYAVAFSFIVGIHFEKPAGKGVAGQAGKIVKLGERKPMRKAV